MGIALRRREKARRRAQMDAAKRRLAAAALERAGRLNSLMRVVETPIGLRSSVELAAARELESEGWATLCGWTCWFLVKPGGAA